MARAIHLPAGMVLISLTASAALASESGGSGGPVQVDFWQAGFTIVVFVLLAMILGKFAWKPILSALQKREEFIRDSLEQAKKDREQAQAKLEEYVEKVEAARGEASAIVDEGRRDAEVLRRKLEEDAKKEAAALVQRAKREIGAAKDTAIRELYDLGARLATDTASRIIDRELRPEDHKDLIAESIEKLGKIDRN